MHAIRYEICCGRHGHQPVSLFQPASARFRENTIGVCLPSFCDRKIYILLLCSSLSRFSKRSCSSCPAFLRAQAIAASLSRSNLVNSCWNQLLTAMSLCQCSVGPSTMAQHRQRKSIYKLYPGSWCRLTCYSAFSAYSCNDISLQSFKSRNKQHMLDIPSHKVQYVSKQKQTKKKKRHPLAVPGSSPMLSGTASHLLIHSSRPPA